MKRILSQRKVALILLVLTVITLAFYTYMIARPIAYGMRYRVETVYAGVSFEGEMVFHLDDTMENTNTNFSETMESYYFYTDGYIFFTLAQNEEEYRQEVKIIKENVDAALLSPFYSAECNAFRVVMRGIDGYTNIYTCTASIVFAAVGGAVELALLAFCCASLVLSKKAKRT